MDAFKNFAVSTIAVAPSPASSGTSLQVQPGDGAKFPATPFNVLIYPVGSLPNSVNAEIGTITVVATDTFTIVRAQETTAARAVQVGDVIAAPVTAKTYTELRNSFDVIGGRLTLTTGVPVTVSNVSSVTNVYYTPYRSNRIALYDGAAWGVLTFSEITQALGTLVAFQGYDMFAYNNAGAVALEMAEWKNATVTMTIASPGVVTWTSHGMTTGNSITFTTSGALPTGVTANTQYFITLVDANSFKLSTSRINVAAGTFVNTSGTQSGTHTGHQPQSRQTGLSYQDGVLVKSGTPTRRYLGSFMTVSTTATEDSDSKRLLYNHYNRVRKRLFYQETGAASWTYTTATTRVARANEGNRIEVFVGWQDYVINAVLDAFAGNSSGAVALTSTIGLDDTANPSASNIQGTQVTQAGVNNMNSPSFFRAAPSVGYHALIWQENSGAGVGTTTWFGTGNSLFHGDTEA